MQAGAPRQIAHALEEREKRPSDVAVSAQCRCYWYGSCENAEATEQQRQAPLIANAAVSQHPRRGLSSLVEFVSCRYLACDVDHYRGAFPVLYELFLVQMAQKRLLHHLNALVLMSCALASS